MKPTMPNATSQSEVRPTLESETESGGVGVIAVTRALKVLECFEAGEAGLNLAELSRRTGLHKTTVLRLARTLAKDNYLVQRDDASWRLGRAAGWLGSCYQAVH